MNSQLETPLLVPVAHCLCSCAEIVATRIAELTHPMASSMRDRQLQRSCSFSSALDRWHVACWPRACASARHARRAKGETMAAKKRGSGTRKATTRRKSPTKKGSRKKSTKKKAGRRYSESASSKVG